MKKFIMGMVFILSFGASAQTHQKVVTGDVAQKLFEALYKSGLTIVENDKGFATLYEESVYCRSTREHAVTGGIFANRPVCFAKAQGNTGFSFDKQLKDTSALMEALSNAGGDADGAMGSFYMSAEKISCQYLSDSRETTCTMWTYQE